MSTDTLSSMRAELLFSQSTECTKKILNALSSLNNLSASHSDAARTLESRETMPFVLGYESGKSRYEKQLRQS